jgi:hypothetical protein
MGKPQPREGICPSDVVQRRGQNGWQNAASGILSAKKVIDKENGSGLQHLLVV